MSDKYILGIDSGNTVTKAAVFHQNGTLISVGHCLVEHIKPKHRFVERDMDILWDMSRKAIRQAIHTASIDPESIVAVSVTGHGDGLYLVDENCNPLENGITSLDSRSADVIDRWRIDGVLDEALIVTGQMPYAPAPSAILRWIKEYEPERYAKIGWVLSCKDWLRYKLTGKIATDWTEASTSFVDPYTQEYSTNAFKLFDLQEIEHAMPESYDPCAIVGEVTKETADQTGLKAGTPVAIGLHDVTASAVGAGVVEPGLLSIVAGSFSINEIISSQPHPSSNWCCRNSFRRGEWMNMALSPASSANIEWFVNQCCRDAILLAEQKGGSLFDYLEEEIADAFKNDCFVVYHPFLYGSPHSNDALAAFLGLHGGHHRGHMLRALFEGVVFNHRHHVDALKTEFIIKKARLTGGSSRSSRMCQLFSNGLGIDIEVVDVDETGALGAALCGAVGIGLFDSLVTAAAQAVSVSAFYSPQKQIQSQLDTQYKRYTSSIAQLQPEWLKLRGEEH